MADAKGKECMRQKNEGGLNSAVAAASPLRGWTSDCSSCCPC